MCDQHFKAQTSLYEQSDQSLCLSLEYSMSAQLLTEHHLEFLRLKGGCTGLSESTLVKMPHCWKSHVAAHLSYIPRKPVLISNGWIQRRGQGVRNSPHGKSQVAIYFTRNTGAALLKYVDD